MISSRVLILLALLATPLFLAVPVRAEDEEEASAPSPADEATEATEATETAEEPVDPSLVYKSADAETTVIFPTIKDSKFPAGGVAVALISFHNKGVKTFNVLAVEGSFRHPQDFRYHIQNFTAIGYNVTVQAGEETTLSYRFRPHENFEPRDIGFQLNVHYTDSEEGRFVDSVYNQTVAIVDSDEPFDTQKLFSYVAGIAIVAGIFLVYKQSSTPKETAAAAPAAPVETGTAGDSKSEWLENMIQPGSGRSPRRKAGGAKKDE